MSIIEIPLFPLRSVLFPGGLLPLRIFEQRYLKMVRDCARNETGFGVCLIREGEEAVSPVKTTEIGTHARIVDWYTVRFVVDTSWQEDDGLFRARVNVLPEPAPHRLPEAYSLLAEVLGRFMEKVGHQYPSWSEDCLEDAVWVGYRLAELLPLAGIEKQHLLELSDPMERLQSLVDVLPRFQSA
jgi:hypothetical protein